MQWNLRTQHLVTVQVVHYTTHVVIIESIYGCVLCTEDIDGDDETVFRHKLDYLRSQAEIFLKMLNDMRRRLKELPPDAPAALQ